MQRTKKQSTVNLKIFLIDFKYMYLNIARIVYFGFNTGRKSDKQTRIQFGK